MDKRKIIFEEIVPAYKWMIRWYLFRNFEIYYYRINASAVRKPWLNKLILNDSLIKVDSKYDFLSYAVGHCPDLAYKNIDRVADYIMRDDAIVRRLTVLYKDKVIYNAFKKNLLDELSRFYYLNNILHGLNRLFPERQILFVYALNKEIHRTYVIDVGALRIFKNAVSKSGAFCYENKNIVFPTWFVILSWLKYAINLASFVCKAFAFCVWTIFYIFLNVLTKKNPNKKRYKFGIMIISMERQFSNRFQKIDFLLDGKKINKDNALFISWRKLPAKYKEDMINYNLFFVDDLLRDITWAANDTVPETLFLMTKVFKYRKKMFLLNSALMQLACYAIWKSFDDHYHVDNLVSHADFALQSITRNILLSKSGTKTWNYLDAISWNNFGFTDTTPANVARYNHMLGFAFYDYLISWSDEVIEYFKLHNQNINYYINVGCLWAQHIKEVAEGKIKSNLKNKLLESGFKKEYKLVTVFDSTYLYYLNTYKNGIEFLQHIYNLLEEMPDVFVLFKEKKSRAYVAANCSEMIQWLKKIESHPRCYTPLSNLSAAEAIAFSDLVISFPATSPTFEALSARKKAIYYDVAGEFNGTFYDKIPGLLCHNYSELKERVRELLFQTDEHTYNQYLDKIIKDKVEPYLDGNALTRFRDLLTYQKAYSK